MLKKLTVSEFTKALESKKPTPGGGAASALSFSLASSLLAMVLNLTIGHKCSKDYSPEVIKQLKGARDQAKEARLKAIDLMEADAYSYSSYLKAFKMPKETLEEKEKRKKEIEFFKKETLRVPYDIATEAFKLYEPLKLAVKYGNRNAISDGAVSAMMLHAAIEGAAFNVFINLPRKNLNPSQIELKNEISSLILKSDQEKNAISHEVREAM